MDLKYKFNHIILILRSSCEVNIKENAKILSVVFDEFYQFYILEKMPSKQDIEHFHHPRKFPHDSSKLSPPRQLFSDLYHHKLDYIIFGLYNSLNLFWFLK